MFLMSAGGASPGGHFSCRNHPAKAEAAHRLEEVDCRAGVVDREAHHRRVKSFRQSLAEVTELSVEEHLRHRRPVVAPANLVENLEVGFLQQMPQAVEGVPIIIVGLLVQRPRHRGGENQDAVRLEDAGHFRDDDLRLSHVLEHLRADDRVECPLAERQHHAVREKIGAGQVAVRALHRHGPIGAVVAATALRQKALVRLHSAADVEQPPRFHAVTQLSERLHDTHPLEVVRSAL